MDQAHQDSLANKSLRSFLRAGSTKDLPSEYSLLLQKMKKISYRPGDVIIREGDIGDSFYIIDNGRVAVISEKDNHKSIGVIGEGEFFGELALLTQRPRTATIKAETDATMYRLSKKDFDEITQRYPTINGFLLSRLYDRIKSAYGQLELQNEQLKELNRIRTQLASIFTMAVLFISFYTFVLGFFNSSFMARHELAEGIKDYVSRAIEVGTLAIVIRMIINSRLSLKDFGVTIKGWRRSVLESVAVSAVIVALLCLFKTAANSYHLGIFKETELVCFDYFGLSYIAYLVVAPLQEFIARGTVQSTLERLFVGRSSGFRAILVTSFLFGSLHVYSSINLALLALLTSWLWGWMYNRQQNLIGVSLSHFLIGNSAGLMGYWSFF